MTKKEMLEKYIESQEGTVESVGEQLKNIESSRHVKGWFMVECQMMDSRANLGQKVLFPYGPECTLKEMPDPSKPYSINGMPSGMGSIIGHCEV